MTEQPFPDRFFGIARDPSPQQLGYVVEGSLSEGVVVRLDENAVLEGVKVGTYVSIKGQTDRTFFGLVTDVDLGALDPKLMRASTPNRELRQQAYKGIYTFGLLRVKLMLVREGAQGEFKPVRSIPEHFSIAYRSTPEEVQAIFQADKQSGYRIGEAVDDPSLEVTIDLERIVERSTAVFGRSGTGKTFLTLPLLAQVIRANLASVLIFDMHNDYGYTLKGDGNKQFHGLKRLGAIRDRVVIVTLDEDSSRQRNASYEFPLQIGYNQIEPEDIEMLRGVLGLSDVQVNALYALKRRSPTGWIRALLSDEDVPEVRELIEANKLTESTYNAMQRKLGRLLSFGFLKERVAEDYAERILQHLQRGDSVVVEFGRYGDDLPAYVFVANFLTRRIHARYVEMKELAQGGLGNEPKKLVIAIEEAHKFLQPGIADLTVFGTIARELRKYNVTLLIVDQRPSQIDSEVMSQIGTRITCALSDEKDIAAVLTGVSGAHELRNVLASLDTKQQALIMGHAVPMPVVVRTTEYGEAVYKAFADPLEGLSLDEVAAENRRKLGRRGLDEDLV